MLKKILQRFFDLSIRKKIILCVYIIILVIFFALSTALLSLANTNSRNELLSSAANLVEYGNLLIEKEQQYLYGIAAYYAITPGVQELIISSNAGIPSSALSDDLISVSQARKYVLGLAFYNLKGENIAYMSIDASYGAVDQDPLNFSRPFAQLMTGRRTYVWEYINKGEKVYLEHDNSPKLCLWYVVKNNNNLRPIGVIAISLDTRKLLSSQSTFDDIYDTLMLVDSDGRKVFGKGAMYADLTAEELNYLLDNVEPYNKTGYFTAKLRGEDTYAVWGKVSGTDFVTFTLLPKRSFIWDSGEFYVYSVVGILLCIISLLPLLILISNTITRPLNKLMSYMQRFADGDRDVKLDFKHNDEIGKLGAIFNDMVVENKQLIETTYMLAIRKQAAEVASLQAQINPHFIYNMLNSIQWTAIDKGDNDTAETAYAMAQMFSITLNYGNNFITVQQECELLQYYLFLQQKRFAGRLSYDLDFDKSLLGARIPKLMIQPLVENSIIHGVADSSSHVHINVKVARNGERISISVIDDGIGISPEMLALLPDKLPYDENNRSSKSSRFALKNIYDRLRLYYGEASFKFDFFSIPGSSTTVLIDVPIKCPFALENLDKGGTSRVEGRSC